MAVAYLGGFGLALGVSATLVLGHALGMTPAVPVAIAAPGAAFLALGCLDDIRPLSAGKKFALQGACAALAVALGVRVQMHDAPLLAIGLSWLWICTMVNAFNFVDVCDGLVAGLSLPCFGVLSLLEPSTSHVSLSILGAAVGFLVFNRPPATIFLGDGGSHLLGFVAAAITLKLPGASFTSWASAPVVVFVFLFETVFITATRIRRGHPWWTGGPDHFALRLQAAGLTRWQTDAISCAAGACCAATALLLRWIPAVGIVMMFGLLGASAVTWGQLLRWNVGAR